MNVEYTVYETYYLTTVEWKVNQWRGWYIGTRSIAGAQSKHILGYVTLTS